MIEVDVLLVNPSFISGFDMVEPLGLQYLAASLRQEGYTVEILDAMSQVYDSKKTAQTILAKNFKLLGFTIPFQDKIAPTLSFIDNLKEHGVKAHITIGAHPPTFIYENILKYCQSVDSIVRGEGEHTFLELTKKICNNSDWTNIAGIAYRDDNQVIVTPPRPLIKDLDELPWPVRDVIIKDTNRIPAISISSSRGCYSNCSFCSISAFYHLSPGPRWRARKAEQLVDEVEHCINDLKINKIFFVDDNFIGPGKRGRNRAYEIAEEILERKLKIIYGIACRSENVDEELFAILKQSGLQSVFIGIESGNQSTLDIFNKNITVEQNKKAIKTLQELEINLIPSLILVNPYSTLNEIRQDITFIKETNCGPEMNHLKALELLSGISLIEKLRKDNLLKPSLFGDKYNFKNKRVQMIADILIDQLRPKFEKLTKKITELRRQNNALEGQYASSPLLENINQELKKLDSNLKNALFNTINEILDSAESEKHFSSSINKEIAERLERRLSELSKIVSDIKNSITSIDAIEEKPASPFDLE